MDNIESLKAVVSTLSLDELGDLTKTTLSLIYSKLREEKGFGYNQCASFETFGCDPYDVRINIIDNPGFGVDYLQVYGI